MIGPIPGSLGFGWGFAAEDIVGPLVLDSWRLTTGLQGPRTADASRGIWTARGVGGLTWFSKTAFTRTVKCRLNKLSGVAARSQDAAVLRRWSRTYNQLSAEPCGKFRWSSYYCPIPAEGFSNGLLWQSSVVTLACEECGAAFSRVGR